MSWHSSTAIATTKSGLLPVGELLLPVGRLDERHTGWETHAQAADGFDEGIRTAPPGDLIIATHGMCLTAWMVHRGLVETGDEAIRFWEALTLLDVIRIPV